MICKRIIELAEFLFDFKRIFDTTLAHKLDEVAPSAGKLALWTEMHAFLFGELAKAFFVFTLQEFQVQASLEIMRQLIGMIQALDGTIHVARVAQILEARRFHAQDLAVFAGPHLRACPEGNLHKICHLR